MIQTFVLICHLMLALAIVGLVLLQRGKGAEAGTGFGAGASGTVFGARGSASFFSRATAVLATLFFATSLTLAYFATQTTGSESLVGSAAGENAAEAPREDINDAPELIGPVSDGSEAGPAEGASSGAASEEDAGQ